MDDDELLERRGLATEFTLETRGDGQLPTIRGHAAVFAQLSDNLGGFREQIKPGAFDPVMDNDVRALFNHNDDHVLGRSTSGTLTLGLDAAGLTYDIDTPDTQQARDLVTLIKRGDVSQSSFGFNVDEDKWDEDDDGRIVRTIITFKKLWDVSPVTFPAYPQTDVAARSMTAFMEQRKRASRDSLQPYKDHTELLGRLSRR